MRNPSNGKVIGSVPDMNEEDTQVAIDAAEKAFHSWKRKTGKVCEPHHTKFLSEIKAKAVN